MFIYGSLFLWGNDFFGQGWGSWQDISKEISLLPLPPPISPIPRFRAFGDQAWQWEMLWEKRK